MDNQDTKFVLRREIIGCHYVDGSAEIFLSENKYILIEPAHILIKEAEKEDAFELDHVDLERLVDYRYELSYMMKDLTHSCEDKAGFEFYNHMAELYETPAKAALNERLDMPSISQWKKDGFTFKLSQYVNFDVAIFDGELWCFLYNEDDHMVFRRNELENLFDMHAEVKELIYLIEEED